MVLMDEEFNNQLARGIENSVRDRQMSYPNLLDFRGAPIIAELQCQRIVEFNWQAKEKRRHLEN